MSDRFFRLAILSLFIIVPAGAATSDLTLPVFGRVTLPHVTYKSEIVITNHRGTSQNVAVYFIGREDVGSGYVETFTIGAQESLFKTDFLERNLFAGRDGVGAVRLVAVKSDGQYDPNGNIDANVFVIAQRPDGGTSRQEVHSVPATEYFANKVTLAAIRHDEGAYTNVGFVNLAEFPQRFHIAIAGRPWIDVDVPAMTSSQIRLPIEAVSDRSIVVYPDWAVTLADPAIPRPWAAYASTIDGRTGDAFTALRIIDSDLR
jgi:hypothetical protein